MTPTVPAQTDEIQRQFLSFHTANPHVLATLEKLAAEWFQTHQAVGVGMLWERMRWELGISGTGDSYGLPNNFRSRYSRLMLARHPEWSGRIRTASLRSSHNA